MATVTIKIGTEANPLGTPIETWTDEDILGLKLDISLFDLGKNTLTIPRSLWEASSLKPYGDGAYYCRVEVPYIHSGPGPFWAFWLVSGEFVLVDPEESGNETVTIGGPGPLWYMTKARLNYTEYSDTPGVYVKDGRWHFVDKTYGAILQELINEDQAGPRTALGDLDTPGWSNTIDVDGNPWPSFDGIWSTDVGTDYLSIIRELQKADELFVWMTPDLSLRAFQSYGRDLTGGAFGTGVVRFQRGANIIGQLRRQNEKGTAYSHVLALGNDKRVDGEVIEGHPIHLWEEASGFTPGDPIRQGFMTYDTNSLVILERAAQRYIRRSRDRAERLIRCEIMPGQSESTGLYLPGDASTDKGNFWIGDTVTFDTGGGNDLDLNETDLVIAKIEMQLGDAVADDSNQHQERSWRVFIETGDDLRPSASADTSGNTGSTAGIRCRCFLPGNRVDIETDLTWKAMEHASLADGEINPEPADWKEVGFDDSVSPWEFVEDATSDPDADTFEIKHQAQDAFKKKHEFFYRKEFWLEADQLSGADVPLHFFADDGGAVYINGTQVYSVGTQWNAGPSDTSTTIARSNFVAGLNCVGIYTWNQDAGTDGTAPNPGGCYTGLKIEILASDHPLGDENTWARDDHRHPASQVSIVDLAGNYDSDNVEGALAEITAGGGAPTTADYLVGTAQGALSAEIVVGTTPGGELGGTWASPTVDATHSGSTHSAATDTHIADTSDAHDASAISIADAGGYYSGTDVEAALQEVGTLTGGGAMYATPQISNVQSAFQAASTTVATTMTAPAIGDNLIAIVGGRLPNSITQTNVTWTQRYAGVGNSQNFSIWTGVPAASAGTTATANFTGSGQQQMDTFVLDGVAQFTAASVANTSTGSGSANGTVSGSSLTDGGYYIIGGSWPVGATYMGASNPWCSISGGSGQLHSAILRLSGDRLFFWAVSTSGTANRFHAIVRMT